MEEEMIEVTMEGKTFQVNKMLWHFIEFLKAHDEEASNISNVINDMQTFLHCWDDFKRSKKDFTYDNKNLQRFNLFHTIKPKTQYYDQQRFDEKGKPLLFPVYRVTSERVHSMACGENYPIQDCILYVGDGKDIVKLSK